MKAILALKTSSAPTSDHKKLMEMMFANAREDSREANETVTPTAPGVGTKLCPWGEDRVVPGRGGRQKTHRLVIVRETPPTTR